MCVCSCKTPTENSILVEYEIQLFSGWLALGLGFVEAEAVAAAVEGVCQRKTT